MRTLIITCLCFVFAQIAMTQIECISLVSIAEPAEGESIELFPKNFLTNPDAIGDFTISLDEGVDRPSIEISPTGRLLYFVTITDNNTGSTCSTVLSILTDIDFEPDYPNSKCKNDIVLIQDIDNSLSIEDIDDGSFDEITPTDELIFSIAKSDDTVIDLKPGDDGFQTTEELFYSSDDICEIKKVNLFVWDTDGFLSICRSHVFISATTADCAFGNTTCESNLQFMINEDGYLLSGYDFISGAGSIEIAIDDGPYYTFIPLSLQDIGVHSFRIRDENVVYLCEGTFEVIEQTGNQPPIPICETLVVLNLDITNRITLDDVDAGSYDDETVKSELIFSLTKEGEETLNPSDDGFMAVDFVEFSREETCNSTFVALNIWDEEGLGSACLVTVQITDNLSLCIFNANNLNCNSDQIFYVDDNQDMTLTPRLFLAQFGETETLLLSVDNGPFLESIDMSLRDLGLHEFMVSNISGTRECTGSFEIQEICTSEPCPSKFSFSREVASEGESICLSASGIAEFPLSSIQSGITWDPNVLQYTGIMETGTLNGITVNDAEANNGVLRFVWIVGLGDDPLEGDFGFDICFDVIGKSGEASDVRFQDLPGLRFEVSGGTGSTFPMILESGQVCINTCPDGNGNTCFSFDQGQCATDEFADLIDSNASASDMASQMKSYLESKSLLIEDIRVIKSFHEGACEACGICPEPHRFFVKLSATQHREFEELELLNTEPIDCIFFDRAEVTNGEIPLYINLANVSKEETVIRFTVNGKDATIYDNATYGIPQSFLVAGTNELSIENSSGSILNGVSTLDIVMTLQYILGLESLMPHQMIAADIDKSGDVSLTNDIVKMSNLILEIDNSIEGSNWFFIPESEAFGQPFDFNGFDFVNDYYKYDFLDSAINPSVGMNVDVYKYGDLNRNFALNRTDGEGLLEFQSVDLIKGEDYDIEFLLHSDGINRFVGAQAAIEIEDVLIQGLSHDYGTALNYVIEDNLVKFSFASGEEFDQISFRIQLKSNTQDRLENIMSIEENFPTEFITRELNVFDINLSSVENTTPTKEFNISKVEVYPNPVLDNFNIIVPNNVVGEFLNIYNSQGQLEYSAKIDKKEMVFSVSDLNSKGLKIITISSIPSQKFLIH